MHQVNVSLTEKNVERVETHCHDCDEKVRDGEVHDQVGEGVSQLPLHDRRQQDHEVAEHRHNDDHEKQRA